MGAACALSAALAPAAAFADGIPLLGSVVHTFGQQRLHDRDFSLLRSMDMNTVRVDAQWKYAETTKGQLSIPGAWNAFVNRSISSGITPLLILDYGNKFYDNGDKPLSPEAIQGFVNYAKFVVGHFKGRVKYYEVWNEWDANAGGTRNGTPAGYAALVSAVVPAIKAIDPNCVVLVGAGTMGSIRSGWLQKIAALGAFRNADGVAVHAYFYMPGPGVLANRNPEQYAVWISQLHDQVMTAAGRNPLNFYVTEIGWPTYSGPGGVSQEEQMEYFQRTIYLSSTLPFIKGLWWYDLVDDGPDPTDKENNFGLLTVNGTPKAAVKVVNKTVSFARSNTIRRRSPISGTTPAVTLEATGADGRKAAIAWSHNSPVSICTGGAGPGC
jgi:hypothetical protein